MSELITCGEFTPSLFTGIDAFKLIREELNPIMERLMKDGGIKKKDAKIVFSGSGWNYLFDAFHRYAVTMSPHQFANHLGIAEVDFKEDETLADNTIKLDVSVSTLPKCARCWLRSVQGWPPVSDVGTGPTWKALCNRCAAVVDGMFDAFLESRGKQ